MMRRRLAILVGAMILAIGPAGSARAGMPSVTLTDVARLRVRTISFFLLGILLCAWGVQGIWNGLRRDFPRLPRLSYGRGLGLVALWGLLFVLVLTMISGARELMTPGAWTKLGYTYTLNAPPADAAERPMAARRQALDRLRIALATYARGHGGRFPAEADRRAIPVEAWRVPDPSGMEFLYVEGRDLDSGPLPVAIEPGIFGRTRLGLRADGRIEPLGEAEIRDALGAGTRR